MAQPPISLVQVRIDHPCTEDWHRMTGDGARRFCDKCQLHVHNLSAMPPAAAHDLLQHRTGRLCVRYEASPAPAPRRPSGRRRFAAMLGLSALGVWALGTTGCDRVETQVNRILDAVYPSRRATMGRPAVMGAMAAPPTPPPSPAVMGELEAPSCDVEPGG